MDDLRLIFALLHSNVDQFIAHKIMTVYASRINMKESDAVVDDNPKFCGCMKAFRPTIRLPEWLSKKPTAKTQQNL